MRGCSDWTGVHRAAVQQIQTAGEPGLKQSILSLARANGIPATDVYEVDASKQSKRVSANVSGFLGTERITLNDNLLARCSPQAILAVMGHEMGHYVLHHIYNAVIFFTIVIVVLFWALRHGMESALARWGERWSLGGVSDVAALPVAVVILSILGFLFTPISIRSRGRRSLKRICMGSTRQGSRMGRQRQICYWGNIERWTLGRWKK